MVRLVVKYCFLHKNVWCLEECVSYQSLIGIVTLFVSFCAALKPAVTHVHDHAFIRDHFVGVGEKSSILRWMVSDFLFA